MFDWLAEALEDASHVVTASRRLARILQAEYGQQQVAEGKTAWRTPTILAYSDWLATMFSRADASRSLPTRINGHQGHLLWERSIRRAINNPLLNFTLLARQSADAWACLHEWRVPLQECAAAASGKDQRLFVRAARNYQSILENENWIDRAGIPGLVTQLISDGRLPPPQRISLVGFDRVVPEVAALLEALKARGCDASAITLDSDTGHCTLHRYENPAAEMRAAGAWAQEELGRKSQQRIGIVVPALEQNAQTCARLLREGLLPGWQNGGETYLAAVNVSYGRKLADYPAIAIALASLRWLHSDLSTLELSQLLRTPTLGLADTDARSRLEWRLRQMPDRNWSPTMLVAMTEGTSYGADASDWLQRIAALAEHRSKATLRRSPAQWAELFDALLTKLNWPGEHSLSSVEYQLVNRWRELLNDLAQLELVTPTLTLAEAQVRLAALAGETVFQPEAEGAVVQLLGPLEAAGMQFDKLWIAGVSSSNWPPPSKPLALISRDVQRERGMPDADPQDTLDYASRVLHRLLCSASACVLSCPETDEDTEQVVSSLVTGRDVTESPGPADPKWHAAQLVAAVGVQTVDNDPVPPVQPGEIVGGGAMTIQRQLTEPFAAFVYGRLGVRSLYPIVAGLAPNVRGNLLHDALHALYSQRPAQQDIAAWDDAEITLRIEQAVGTAFRPYQRYADGVLRQLLELEKDRAGELLRGVVAIDSARSEFRIAGVENSVNAEISGVALHFRLDRIDADPYDHVIILDYKTGRPKQLLDGHDEPRDMQLIAYSCAIPEPVAAIGLVNIDARGINLDAAGSDFTPDLDWPTVLGRWQEEVRSAARDIAGGDVRIASALSTAASRPLGLLSRYRELLHDA